MFVFAMSFDELLRTEQQLEDKLSQTTDLIERKQIRAKLRKVKQRITRCSCQEDFNRWG